MIGEVRGQEAVDLLQAMNTGHDGSFCTGHANSCRDMLARLETMVLMGMELPLPAIRSQIASALDVMVHVARMRDRSRKVTAIEEVVGIEPAGHKEPDRVSPGCDGPCGKNEGQEPEGDGNRGGGGN